MSFLLFPDLMFDTYTELTPAYLKEKGVTLLLSDLDNTLALHETARPTDAVRAWVRELTEGGVQLMIVSNNRKPDRVRAYCHDLGIPYVGHAGKPKRGRLLEAMERFGGRPAMRFPCFLRGADLRAGQPVALDRLLAAGALPPSRPGAQEAGEGHAGKMK